MPAASLWARSIGQILALGRPVIAEVRRLRRFRAVSCPIRLVAATALPERCGRPSGLGRVTEIEAPTIGMLYRNHQLAISVQRGVIARKAGIRRFSCSEPG